MSSIRLRCSLLLSVEGSSLLQRLLDKVSEIRRPTKYRPDITQGGSMNCRRCLGSLIYEYIVERLEGGEGETFRCINCGDIVFREKGSILPEAYHRNMNISRRLLVEVVPGRGLQWQV